MCVKGRGGVGLCGVWNGGDYIDVAGRNNYPISYCDICKPRDENDIFVRCSVTMCHVDMFRLCYRCRHHAEL